MEHQPTNKDIQESFNAHTREDHRFQEETRNFNGEMAGFKAETEGSLAAIHKKIEGVDVKIEGLATKEDIKELKAFMEKVNIGVGIFTFSFKNAKNIGSFIVLLVALYLLIKVGIAGAIAWLIHR